MDCFFHIFSYFFLFSLLYFPFLRLVRCVVECKRSIVAVVVVVTRKRRGLLSYIIISVGLYQERDFTRVYIYVYIHFLFYIYFPLYSSCIFTYCVSNLKVKKENLILSSLTVALRSLISYKLQCEVVTFSLERFDNFFHLELPKTKQQENHILFNIVLRCVILYYIVRGYIKDIL